MNQARQSRCRSPLSVEDFFRLVCENHCLPVLLTDPASNRIVRANAGAGVLYGYPPSDLEGICLADLMEPPITTSTIDPRDKLVSHQRTADGSLRAIELSPRLLPLADADILYCILRDVTDCLRARREREDQEMLRHQLEVVVHERTRQLDETLANLRQESLRRRQIESNVTAMRENLEQQERARVARDIHDGIGQTLQAIKLQLKMRQARCREGEPCGGQALNDIIAELGATSAELREIIMALRPLFLEDTDLDMAVRSLCERSAKRTGLDVRAECQGTFRGLGSSFKLSIFRICQEALANIVKHSGFRSAVIRLEREPRTLRVTIRDDGIGGVSCPTIITREGSGLAIMRERVELLSGTLTVISPPGLGTVITAEVPLQ